MTPSWRIKAGRKGGKKGGRSRSAAKRRAARANGKLGGRPLKHIAAFLKHNTNQEA